MISNRDVIIYDPGDITNVFSFLEYGNIALEDIDTDENQLEVVRKFDTTVLEATLVGLGQPLLTGGEKRTLFTLPNEDTSGSSMYTVDSRQKIIVLSKEATDYVWRSGIHHSRSFNMTLPLPTIDDTIIIRRKTPVLNPVVVWIDADTPTSLKFNADFEQILKLTREIRTEEEEYGYFSFYRDAREGYAPLDEDSLVPDNKFPAGIGPTGVPLSNNLEGTRVETFSDVLDLLPVEGYDFAYLEQYDKWVPSYPFESIDKFDGGILRLVWSVSGWTGLGFKINYLTDVLAKRDRTGDGAMYQPETGEMLQWYDVASQNSPSSHADQWGLSGITVVNNEPLEPGDRWNLMWSTVSNRWLASSIIIDEMPVYIWEDEVNRLTSIGDVDDYYYDPIGRIVDQPGNGDVVMWDATAEKWKNQPAGSWSGRNGYRGSATVTDPTVPEYTAGYTGDDLWQFYKNGFVMYWHRDLFPNSPYEDPQDPLESGAFTAGLPLCWDPQIVTDQNNVGAHVELDGGYWHTFTMLYDQDGETQESTEDLERQYNPVPILRYIDGVLRLEKVSLKNIGRVGDPVNGYWGDQGLVPVEGSWLEFKNPDNNNQGYWAPHRYTTDSAPTNQNVTTYSMNLSFDTEFRRDTDPDMLNMWDTMSTTTTGSNVGVYKNIDSCVHIDLESYSPGQTSTPYLGGEMCVNSDCRITHYAFREMSEILRSMERGPNPYPDPKSNRIGDHQNTGYGNTPTYFGSLFKPVNPNPGNANYLPYSPRVGWIPSTQSSVGLRPTGDPHHGYCNDGPVGYSDDNDPSYGTLDARRLIYAFEKFRIYKVESGDITASVAPEEDIGHEDYDVNDGPTQTAPISHEITTVGSVGSCLSLEDGYTGTWKALPNNANTNLLKGDRIRVSIWMPTNYTHGNSWGGTQDAAETHNPRYGCWNALRNAQFVEQFIPVHSTAMANILFKVINTEDGH